MQLHELHAQRIGAFARGMKRPGDGLHADGVAQPQHFRADGARADDAERLAAEEHSIGAVPMPLLDPRGEVRALGRRQQQRQRVLGHDRRRLLGDVANDDAEVGRRLHVDGVVAHAAGGNRLQRRQLLEQFPRPLQVSARVDHNLRILRPAQLLFDRGRPIRIDRHRGPVAQPLQMRRVADLHRLIARRHYPGKFAIRHASSAK